MSERLPVYTLAQLGPLLDRAEVIAAVREALIAHATGAVQSPMPGQLVFPEVHGDCHVKYGHIAGAEHFVVKVATGFYQNPQQGLAVNNGLMLLIDAGTGAPACLFQDEGWMTAWRTAAAVALAAACLAPRADAHVGIVGTGQQAQLAIEWIAELMPAARFSLCGRDAARTRAISARHAAQSIDSIADLLAQCDVIVTVTPATQALFDADQARPRQHFVAVGADGAEKQELPQALYARAQIVVTDDHAQCLALSDFGRAVRDGYIARDADHALGALLAATIACDRQPRDITIVDLTGLAAQDIAIANLFLAKLKHAGRWPMPGDLPFDA